MRVEQLRAGLWRWTGLHPEWTPEEGGPDGWEQEVGCVYYEAPDAVVLVDPLVPPEDEARFSDALDRDLARAARPVHVLLTVFWHERSAHAIAARYGASVHADERRVDRFGTPPTHAFRPGSELAGGVRAIDAHGRNEVLFWIARERALVAGDILLGDGRGGVRLCPESWLHEGVGHRELRAALRPLLELPVELLLVSHGEPVLEEAAGALARALAEPR